MYYVMYNIFRKKNTYLVLLFFLISAQSFSQNLGSKINEDEKFIKLLKFQKRLIVSTLSQTFFPFKYTVVNTNRQTLYLNLLMKSI